MPLAGVRCPVDRKCVSKDACLTCRMSEQPRDGLARHCVFPFEMLAGMLDTSGRARASISATQLSSCPRQLRLMQDYDYYIEPDKAFPAFRGTISHRATEAWPEPGVIYEQRFEYRVPGLAPIFTGQIDVLDIQKRTIRDFKTKKDSGMPDKPKPEHIWQLNCYRFLVAQGWPQDAFDITLPNGDRWEFPVGVPGEVEIDNLVLTYWSMSEVREFSTKHGNMVPIYAEEEVFDYIRRGVARLSTTELPACPEGWGPDSGNPICRSWCPVKDLCEEHLMATLNSFHFGARTRK